MKIYTKKGDQGYTSLFGGTKIEKHHTRIEAYGTVDELNSVLGLALTEAISEDSRSILQQIQHQLFILGADLATLPSKKTKIDRVGTAEIAKLEEWIDIFEEHLSPLTSFILPGGAPPGAALHLARTVCRRAERKVVALKHKDPVSPEALIYLNRLSDLLFVMARFENQQAGVKETVWVSKHKK